MHTQVRVHPLILGGDQWVGYVRRRKKGELELYPSIDHVGEKLRPAILEQLVESDRSLTQLQDLPPLTQAWRWELGEEFSRGRLPVGRTYFFRCEGTPGPDPPERDRIGFEVVNVWVRAESKAKALEIFEEELKDFCLILEQCEGPASCRLEDYESDPEGRERFEQAQWDGIVVVSHVCPQFPVYWVTATAEWGSPARTGEVHYFLSADSICQEGEDVFDPSFWTGEREQAALEATAEAIQEKGWTLTAIQEKRPCGRSDVPEDLVLGYDEAEESGACLVSISDSSSA